MLLNGKWTLNYVDTNGASIALDAIVPGCIHTDLLKNGKIADFYWRDNAKDVQWIENMDCSYTKEIWVETLEKNAFIRFDGLDTYCDIYLNDVLIGACNNMFIPYEFNVDGVLKQGKNKLAVFFRSPIKEVEGKEKRAGAFTTERLHTRRIQCTYGWDWVERFVSMGIYKDVHLYSKQTNQIDNVYVYTKYIHKEFAQIGVEINVADFTDNGDQVQISILSPSGEEIYRKNRVMLDKKIKQTVDILSPALWFPAGYGKQPLYQLCISTPTDKKEVAFGIRQICILQAEDGLGSLEESKCKELRIKEHLKAVDFNERGSSFIAIVNGLKIMCKGANWVPCEPFPSAETDEKISSILQLSVDAGMNMVRVWGGGVFEKEHFYNECDRLGLLVLQDFLMACGTYPEQEEWFIEELKKEAKFACLQLRNHACLAWWHGDNENGVKGNENIVNYDGYLSVKNALAPIIEECDPHREFLQSSPFGGNTFASATKGTSHVTAYLGTIFEYIENSDFSNYVDYFAGFLSRFCSEYPIFGFSFVSSIKKFLTEEDIFGDNDELLAFHSKGNPDLKMDLYDYFKLMAEKIFGTFKDGADKVFKQQYVQCESLRIALENYRRNKWFSSGILFWMLNDCWPASSGWSLIDYYAMPKPAYYAFKRCAKPVIASIERANGHYKVYVCNDALKGVSGTGRIYAYDTACEKEGASFDFAFQVNANESAPVFEIAVEEFALDKAVLILCDIQTEEGLDRAYYIQDKFADLQYGHNRCIFHEEANGRITVEATGFVPFVMLDVPFVVSDNCFMLKKGEKMSIEKRESFCKK